MKNPNHEKKKREKGLDGTEENCWWESFVKNKTEKKILKKRISQKLGWERNKMRRIPLKLRRGQKEKNSEGLVSTEREHIVKPFSRSQINAFVCWLHVFLFHIINLRCNCLHYLPFLLLLLPGIWKLLKRKFTICPKRFLRSIWNFSTW